MKIRTLLCLLLALLLLPAMSSAQVRKTGITGMAFLKVGVGARQVALGSAVTSLREDVTMMFWNPAGMALSDGKTQATFMYNKWIADLGHYAAGVARDFNGIGTLGVGFISFGKSGIGAQRDALDPATAETYDYNDMAIQASYARRFTDRLALGLNVKFLNQSIDTESVSSIAVDFGSTYQIGFKNLTLGARVNNLGGDFKYYNQSNPLPLVFSFGVSADVISKENYKLMLAVDATKPQDTEQLVFSGGELTLGKIFAVRGGYKFLYSGREDRVGLATSDEGVTFGGGLNVALDEYRAKVDYGYTQFGDLFDSVHRVSVMFEF